MYSVPPDWAWWPAVGAQLERGVRHQCAGRAAEVFACERFCFPLSATARAVAVLRVCGACQDFAWRSAPCSAGHSAEFFVPSPQSCARHSAIADHVLHSSERCPPSRSALRLPCCRFWRRPGAFGWSALMPALTEYQVGRSRRVLVSFGPRHHAELKFVAVQFTPTGALPAGVPPG